MAIPLQIDSTGVFKTFAAADYLAVNEIRPRSGSDVQVTGNLIVTGNETVQGNTTLGDASGDAISFTGSVNTAIVTDATAGGRDLGSGAKGWRDLFLSRPGDGGAVLGTARALSAAGVGASGAKLIGVDITALGYSTPAASDLQTVLAALDSAFSGITLNSAYGNGQQITVTAGAGPVIVQRAGGNGTSANILQLTDTQAFDADVAVVTKSPSSAHAGHALKIVTGSNSSASGVYVQHGGTDYAYEALVQNTGKGLKIATGTNSMFDLTQTTLQIGSNAANITTTHYGIFKVPDGTAGAPSIALISDATTGLFRQAANVMAIALGGVERHRFGVGYAIMYGTDPYVFAGDASSGLTLYGNLTTSTSKGAVKLTNNNNYSASSGVQRVVDVVGTVAQSSTAGYTGLYINITESSVGSGTKRLLELNVGGSPKYAVDNVGVVTQASMLSGVSSPTTNFNVTTASRIYYVDTTSGAINAQLPTPVAGMEFLLVDKAGKFDTNAVTLVRAGSEKINGTAASYVVNGMSTTWRIVSDGTDWYAMPSRPLGLATVSGAYITGASTSLKPYDPEILLVDTTSNNCTLTLPAPSSKRTFMVKKAAGGTNKITLAPNGAEKIEGSAASYDLPNSNVAYAAGTPQAWMVFTNGTDWFVA